MKSLASNITLAILVAAFMLLQACGGKRDMSKKDVSRAYDSGEIDLKVDFRVFHFKEDSSRLFVRLNTGQLLYSRAANQSFAANVQVTIMPVLIGGEKDAPALPAKKFRFVDHDDSKEPKDLLASASFYLPQGQKYELRIDVTDLNRAKSSSESIVSDKSESSNREFFLAIGSDGVPLFTDRIAPNRTYRIQTAENEQGPIYVRYYNSKFPLPPPPFAFFEYSPFNYNADATYTLDRDSENEVQIDVAEEGFYHFQSDTTSKEGFSLFISPDEFPEVSNIQNMVDPFRFLVSGREYRQVITAPDMKLAIEAFWVDWSGNKERARSSIKANYTRVEEANKFFSSHVEGWKSDRGMVYMIYGKPNKVYRTPIMESWIYGEENNPLSITFNFIKVINPFTPNDYRLNREDYYKPSWYRSIEAWRNGRVY
jgi:GWxTD domain-containing protein